MTCKVLLPLKETIYAILGVEQYRRLWKEGAKENQTLPEKKMNYRATKFYFEIDEATSCKLKSLIGKTSFNQKEFQKIMLSLISKTYDNSKGKPFK